MTLQQGKDEDEDEEEDEGACDWWKAELVGSLSAGGDPHVLTVSMLQKI